MSLHLRHHPCLFAVAPQPVYLARHILSKADLLLRYTADTGPVAPLTYHQSNYVCHRELARPLSMVANLGDVLRTCDERL